MSSASPSLIIFARGAVKSVVIPSVVNTGEILKALSKARRET